jgi:alpha/beta superfamily hydrolase
MHETIEIPLTGQPWSLEGRWSPAGDEAAVVAPPHPLYGGNADNPVVLSLVEGLAAANHGVLAFNWRGCGRSGGIRSGEFADAEADYRAALDRLRKIAKAPRVAAGYSFGALAAISTALASDGIERLLLVSPPATFFEQVPLERFEGAVDLICGDRDEFSPLAMLTSLEARMPTLNLRILAGADHFFSSGGFAEIREFARMADPFAT